MSDWIRRSQVGRGLFALLLLCALAVRVAVPTGFMPTKGVHGVVISLCTGQGAVKVILPIEQQGDDPADRGMAKDGACSFAAGLGSGLIDAAAPAIAAPSVVFAVHLTSRVIADLTVHRLAAPPPPSHGPPARA